MITVHLLRHGETVWHAENRYAGVSDVALTDRGRQQAEALAPWAVGAGLAAVASSDLSRAVQTGEPVAAAAGVELLIDPGLREVDFGAGEGRTRREMADVFPDGLAAFLAAPGTRPLPDGESGEAAAARGLDALARVTAPFDGQALAVIAHSTLIRLVLCGLLGLPLDDYRRRFPRMGNATITTVTVPVAARGSGLRGQGALLRFNADVTPLSSPT